VLPTTATFVCTRTPKITRAKRPALGVTLENEQETKTVAAIPDNFLDLTQKKAFAQFATLMPDGSPHVSPVWFEYDGKHILINSAKGRVKDRNVRRDPRVGIDIVDPDNPYRHLSIRDKLAKKYRGVDKYQKSKPDEVRVIYRIEPERSATMG
jgi:predicted pyridoxine 5'-phosphate oxidase superfamily flavin-nucleotide-binding protein